MRKLIVSLQKSKTFIIVVLGRQTFIEYLDLKLQQIIPPYHLDRTVHMFMVSKKESGNVKLDIEDVLRYNTSENEMVNFHKGTITKPGVAKPGTFVVSPIPSTNNVIYIKNNMQKYNTSNKPTTKFCKIAAHSLLNDPLTVLYWICKHKPVHQIHKPQHP